MDVHPPYEPIRSARDFFLHRFTITVGLLIALSLESLVEYAYRLNLKSLLPFYANQLDGEYKKF